MQKQKQINRTDSIKLIMSLVSAPPIAFYRDFALLAGSAAGGIWLSQLIYWSNKGKDKDGWIYKTQSDWTSETNLTRSEQESVRRNLRSRGILEEKKKGIPSRLYYRLDLAKLQQYLKSQKDEINDYCVTAKKAKYSRQDSDEASELSAVNSNPDSIDVNFLPAKSDGPACFDLRAISESPPETSSKTSPEISTESEVPSLLDSNSLTQEDRVPVSAVQDHFKAHLDKVSGVFLASEEDVESVQLMVNQYGIEHVRRAAQEVRGSQGTPWVSAVGKTIRPQSAKTANARRMAETDDSVAEWLAKANDIEGEANFEQ